MPVKNISALQADCEQNCSPAADRRHVWPVRTQCLTSAAPCLCPHPNSLITALADPKARFCRSLANPSTRCPPYRGQPADTKALVHRMRTAARMLGLAPACGCFRATTFVLKTRHPAPLHFRKDRNGPERRATNILARPGRACKSPSAVTQTIRTAFADRPETPTRRAPPAWLITT
jgi:hypothetical protein